MTNTNTIAARRTGNKRVTYRWMGEVASGKVCRAQDFPGAEVVSESWSNADIDARVVRRTSVRLPVGLLVIDSTREGSFHEYVAAILSEGVEPLDWKRARHVSFEVRTLPDKSTRRVHTVDVDGVRGEYVESGA